MKKNRLLLIVFSIFSFTMNADDYYDDDIYYNPEKKEKTEIVNIAESSEMVNGWDVDTYNRFGGYYETSIDTIGNGVAHTDDFVYTQQIQKFYNPTIVVDNSDVLADVLNNSYGNVEIVINNGYPTFSGLYTPFKVYCTFGYPYATWNYWYNWGWNSIWYDPWYAWGPSWSWYDPFLGPSWYPHHPPHDPGYYPPHHHHYADYRPQGNRTHRVDYGWSGSSRPNSVGNHRYNSNSAGHYNGSHRSNGSKPGYRVDNNGFRQQGTTKNNSGALNQNSNSYNNHRGNSVVSNKSNNKNSSYKSGITKSNNNSTKINNNRSNNSHRNNGSINQNRSGNHRSSGNFGGSNRGGNQGGGSRGGGRHR